MITPQKGVVIAGRYTLVRQLAQGGMGSIWIARHRDLEVDITVKFMSPVLVASAEARTRFEREARAAARLDSQHVVHVHDYGVEDETPYIVMELLKGESLQARLARAGRVPLPLAERSLTQVCKALRTAHEAGLVHRDLKPGNVFLALKDGDEVVKVLDFGIAKTADFGEAQAHTESGMLLGSVHYMSPEQIRSSRSVDARSDLWSMGVILFRMLAGRLPFPGDNIGDVLVRVCTDPVPSLSSVAPELPAWLDDFFASALARDPEQRFQSASALAEAFSSMVKAAPVSASPADAPRWKKTIVMGEPVPPSGVGAGEITNELPTQKKPDPPPQPRLAMDSAAEELTVAVPPAIEANSGTFRGVQIAPQVGLPRVMLASGTNEQPSTRSRRPIWLMTAVVTVVAIVGVLAFRRGTTPRSAVETAITSTAPIPVVPVTATDPSVVPSAAGMEPAPSAIPVQSQPSATASAVAPASTVVKAAIKPPTAMKKTTPRPTDTFSQE